MGEVFAYRQQPAKALFRTFLPPIHAHLSLTLYTSHLPGVEHRIYTFAILGPHFASSIVAAAKNMDARAIRTGASRLSRDVSNELVLKMSLHCR